MLRASHLRRNSKPREGREVINPRIVYPARPIIGLASAHPVANVVVYRCVLLLEFLSSFFRVYPLLFFCGSRRFINSNMHWPWQAWGLVLGLVLVLCLASLAGGQWVHCPGECNCETRTVRCISARLSAVPQVPQDTQVL